MQIFQKLRTMKITDERPLFSNKSADSAPTSPKISSSFYEFLMDFYEEEPNPLNQSFSLSCHKDDQEILIKGSRILINPHFPNVLITFEDRSWTYNLKSELAEAKHTTMLIASTSHELRTPLCGIMNALELMREMLSKECQQYHEIALSSAQHLLNTVNDVLVFSVHFIRFIGFCADW